MEHVEVVEVEVLYGDVHGFGGARGFGKFHFETDSFAVGNGEQIEFRARLGLPEKCLIRP